MDGEGRVSPLIAMYIALAESKPDLLASVLFPFQKDEIQSAILIIILFDKTLFILNGGVRRGFIKIAGAR